MASSIIETTRFIVLCLWIVSGAPDDSSLVLPLGIQNSYTVSSEAELFLRVKLGKLDEHEPVRITDTIAIESNLENGTFLGERSRLNVVAIHGKSSSSWSLVAQENRDFAYITLCLDKEEQMSEEEFYIVVRNPTPRQGSELSFRILVQRKDISLDFNARQRSVVSTAGPLTYLVRHSNHVSSSRRDRFLLSVEAETNRDVCMLVAVYNQQCPLKDRPDNVNGAEMFATGLSSVTMTIHTEKFKFREPFFVSVLVLPNNDRCHLQPPENVRHEGEAEPLAELRTGSEAGRNGRHKVVSVEINKLPSSGAYTKPIFISVACVLVLIAVGTIVIVSKQFDDEPSITTRQGRELAEVAVSCIGIDETNNKSEVDGMMRDDAGYGLFCACHQAYTSKTPKHTRRQQRIRQGLMRLRENANLVDMSRILDSDTWFRRNRSRVYLYLVPLLSLFYFIPAIQFAFLAKRAEEMSGSQDLCFHNFKCSKPWFIFSDFNHVVSNLSYVIFGLAFMILVYVKSKKLPPSHNPKNDHQASSTGILQQLSLFYAMGFALFAQGFFSVCYHVCPTNLSLQFDTTMMYVLCVLCYVKMYQFRHPDATANAYSTFAFLGALVFLEALTLYSTSWLVYIGFVVFYVAMTIFVAFDQYHMGIGRLDVSIAVLLAKDIMTNWKKLGRRKSLNGEQRQGSGGERRFHNDRIRYPNRFRYSLLFSTLNLLHAVFIGYSKYRKPEKNVSHVVLTILAGNVTIYLLYYVYKKNFHEVACCTNPGEKKGCFRKWFCCCCCSCRNRKHSMVVFGKKIPTPISSGSFFTLLALACATTAVVFYLDRSANRNLSPAESRDLNMECTALDFYDNHDMWHFFSAAGIFMAFLAILTLDDDLLPTPREQISVF